MKQARTVTVAGAHGGKEQHRHAPATDEVESTDTMRCCAAAIVSRWRAGERLQSIGMDYSPRTLVYLVVMLAKEGSL